MNTNIQQLEEQIQQSTLLTQSQRSALLNRLPMLGSNQLMSLGEVFASKKETVQVDAVSCIARAASTGDASFFAQLDQLIVGESRQIRKAEEAAERSDEEQATTQMFSDPD